MPKQKKKENQRHDKDPQEKKNLKENAKEIIDDLGDLEDLEGIEDLDDTEEFEDLEDLDDVSVDDLLSENLDNDPLLKEVGNLLGIEPKMSEPKAQKTVSEKLDALLDINQNILKSLDRLNININNLLQQQNKDFDTPSKQKQSEKAKKKGSISINQIIKPLSLIFVRLAKKKKTIKYAEIMEQIPDNWDISVNDLIYFLRKICNKHTIRADFTTDRVILKSINRKKSNS